MLVKGGLVESRRGVNGGYVLTRRPEDISAAEIIAALDGPVALTACVDGAVGDCNVESLCPLRGGWDRVNAALRAALESVSLAALRSEERGVGTACVRTCRTRWVPSQYKK